MSFWSRIGDFFTNLGSGAGDLYDSANAIPSASDNSAHLGLAWESAKEDVGDARGFKAAMGFGMQVSGIDALATSLHQPYQSLVAHPVSAGFMGVTNARAGIQHPWDKAWNERGEASPGQAIVAAATGMDPATFDDPVAMKRAFTDDKSNRMVSGTLDLLGNLFADPLVIGSKVGKGLEVAATTVKAKDVAEAVSIAGGRGATAGSKSAATAAGRMQTFFKRTDGMSFADLLQDDVIKSTQDKGAFAALFESANKIDDEALRHAAKADILGTLLGDASARTRLEIAHADLAEQASRFVKPAEGSNSQMGFRLDDYGTKHLIDFHTPERLNEVLAHQDLIKAEMDRLERLIDVAGTTNKIAPSFGAAIPTAARESVIYPGGLSGRPVRVVHGLAGTRIPNQIDVTTVNEGLDHLKQILDSTPQITRESRDKYLKQFASAVDKEDRAKVVWRVENAIYSAMGTAYGRTPAEVRSLVAASRGVRKATRNVLRQRLYTAKEGDPVIFLDPDLGEAVAFSQPFLRTQITNTVPIVDVKALDYVLKTDRQTRFLERTAKKWDFGVDGATRITNAKNQTADFFDDLFEYSMRFWKFGALFRVAYPIRVQVDTQLRNFAALRPIAYALSAKEGSVNFFRNFGKVANPDAPDLVIGMKGEIARLSKELKATPAGPRADALMDDMRRIQREIDRVPKEISRRKSAQRATQLRKAQTYKGVEIQPARNDEELAILNRTLDADGTMARLMSQQTNDELASMRGTGGWEVVTPGARNWEDTYLRAVNQQIRNSPVARILLENPTDTAAAQAIRNSEDAYKEFRMVDHAFNDVEEYISYARAQINHLVNEDVRKIILNRQLTKADLKSVFVEGGPNAKMPVHGENYMWMRDSPAAKALNAFAEKWYQIASDMPETIMGRHPLYNHRFRESMKTQIDRWGFDGPIPEEEITRMRRAADRQARKEVADTLFDLTRRSNASYALRHFSPFFSAWEDTMKKWGNLFYDDPSRMIRFAQAWRAPDQVTTVTDSEGNIVKDGKTYQAILVEDESGDIRVNGKNYSAVAGDQITDPNYKGKGANILLPKFLSFGTSGGRLAVRKDSFNIVFQGEPWWLPGMGPLVQVPTNEIVRGLFPKEADNPVIGYLLPYGTSTESIPAQFMPAWARNARGIFGNGEEAAQVYAMMAAQEYTKDPSKDPDKFKVANQARNWFILKAAMSQFSPVSVAPQARLQFYIERAHEYRDKYGLEWQNKFYDDFPEYYEMTLSMSVNSTGITASEKAFDASKKYRKYIARNPELGWMFVGPDNVGQFDSGVYDWQATTKVSPGTETTFRGKRDPQEAIDRVRASRGWIEYNKAMTFFNTELENRGLHSFSQKGAEDLALAKKLYTDQMKAQNTAWAKDFDTQDSGAVKRALVVAFDAMRENKELAQRPDMQMLVQYVQAREMFRDFLKQQPVKDIDDARNAPIKDAWDQVMQQMMANNIGFELMYNRLLARDDLSQDLRL